MAADCSHILAHLKDLLQEGIAYHPFIQLDFMFEEP